MKLIKLVVDDKITTKVDFLKSTILLLVVFDKRPSSVAADYLIHECMYFLQKDPTDLVKFGRRFMGHPCTITRLFAVFPYRCSHW